MNKIYFAVYIQLLQYMSIKYDTTHCYTFPKSQNIVKNVTNCVAVIGRIMQKHGTVPNNYKNRTFSQSVTHFCCNTLGDAL